MLRKIGKIGKINQAANRRLKKIYDNIGIRSCEARLFNCKNTFGLSWHHRHKRHWYRGQMWRLELYCQTILVCAKCHEKLEKSAELTETIFLKLRGKEL